MNIEELKIIMETVKGIADGSMNVVIVYMLINSILPLMKYSIVGFVILKIIDKFNDGFK